MMSSIAGAFQKNEPSLSKSRMTELVSFMLKQISCYGPGVPQIWVDNRAVMGQSNSIDFVGGIRATSNINNQDCLFQIVIDGKIDNYPSIRSELETFNYIFKSTSDAELIEYGYKHWGVNLFAKLNGFCSIAIWDSASNRMILMCDRIGEKPLFYYSDLNGLIFASAIKSLLVWPGVPRAPDRFAINDYLTFGCISGVSTAFSEIKRLKPAHYMIAELGKELVIEAYWGLPSAPQQLLRASSEDLKIELGDRLRSSMELCSSSGQTHGVFLSNGLGSAALVAMDSASTRGGPKTFYGGFGEIKKDGNFFRDSVTERFDTDHKNFVFGSEVLANTAKLAWVCEEPHASAQSLATYFLASESRKYVAGILSCDGANEVLLGSKRYTYYKTLLREKARGRELGMLYTNERHASKTQRLAADTYCYMSELFKESQKCSYYGLKMLSTIENCSYDQVLSFIEEGGAEEDIASRIDMGISLPNSLAAKKNIAAISCGLDMRYPFLNYEFVEFSMQIPAAQRMVNGQENGLLKLVLEPYLPNDVINGAKMGIPIPISRLIRDVAYEQVRALLLNDLFISRGIFTDQAIKIMLEEHRSNTQDHGERLWALVCLELWFRTWIDKDDGKELEGDDNPFSTLAFGSLP